MTSARRTPRQPCREDLGAGCRCVWGGPTACDDATGLGTSLPSDGPQGTSHQQAGSWCPANAPHPRDSSARPHRVLGHVREQHQQRRTPIGPWAVGPCPMAHGMAQPHMTVAPTRGGLPHAIPLQPPQDHQEHQRCEAWAVTTARPPMSAHARRGHPGKAGARAYHEPGGPPLRAPGRHVRVPTPVIDEFVQLPGLIHQRPRVERLLDRDTRPGGLPLACLAQTQHSCHQPPTRT